MSGVLWITGLSGAGKTSLAEKIVPKFRKVNPNIIQLDGDKLRSIFSLEDFTNDNHSRDSRLSLALRYSKLCKVIEEQKFYVVISTISMFKEVYEWNRKNFINYFEVYLKVPKEELIKRDSKEIYSKFNSGKISNVAGFDFEVDEPDKPNLVFNYNKEFSAEYLSNILYEELNINFIS